MDSADERVLLIDTDTQGQCARMLGVEPPAGLSVLPGETSDLRRYYPRPSRRSRGNTIL